MSVSGVSSGSQLSASSSALIGIASAQSQMDAAASAAARSGVIGDGGGDVVDAVVGGMNAQLSQAVNLAMLRRAMDMQNSIIDVLA